MKFKVCLSKNGAKIVSLFFVLFRWKSFFLFFIHRYRRLHSAIKLRWNDDDDDDDDGDDDDDEMTTTTKKKNIIIETLLNWGRENGNPNASERRDTTNDERGRGRARHFLRAPRR